MTDDRKRFLSIRLTDAEKALIDERVAQSFLSLQSYVLDRLFADSDSMHVTLPEVKRAVVPIVSQLRKIGTNLNQLAHQHNAGRSISRDDLIANIEEVEEICRLLKQRL